MTGKIYRASVGIALQIKATTATHFERILKSLILTGLLHNIKNQKCRMEESSCAIENAGKLNKPSPSRLVLAVWLYAVNF